MLKKDNITATTEQERAGMLSDQYKSVFTDEDTSYIPHKHDPLPSMPDIKVTVKGVWKLLGTLNPRKAAGPDKVPTTILKDYRDILAPVLTVIFQQSLDTGVVPKEWRLANIVAIFKKGDKHDPGNYRPVSLTSIACKSLEHILFSNIMDHYDAHHFLTKRQHGFREKYSCETQLITTVEDILKDINHRRQCDILILDFQKAFDKVPHQRLLTKLDHSGIRGNIKKWIGNWLTDQYQHVVVEGCTSCEERVKSGVPQGTVLGPLMFLTYINDIHEELSSNIRLFADDALLYRPILSRQDTQTLQDDINTLSKWAKRWQMSFNVKKCYVMRAYRGNNITYREYTMDSAPLASVEHHPYLGVELSQDMQWTVHMSNVHAKATRALNMARRNFSRGTSASLRDNIYKTFVRPHLEYSSSVWDPYHSKDIDRMESIQNKAARFVHRNYNTYDSVTAMKQQLGWQPLQERRFIARQKIMYKTVHELHNLEMPAYITTQSSSRRHHHSHMFDLLRANIDLYRFSYYPRTIRTWNLLPSEIVSAQTIASFTAALTKAICDGRIVIIYPKASQYISAGIATGPTVAKPLHLY